MFEPAALRARSVGPNRQQRSTSPRGMAATASNGHDSRLTTLQAQANQGPHAHGLAQLRARLNPPAAPGAPVVQRMSVAGERIFPTGRNGKALLEKVKLGMFSAGLSPHGTTGKFKEVVQGSQKNFASDEEFVQAFVGLAKQEATRVEQAKASGQKKVRGWTRPLKIGRPSWPEAYKKVVQKGQDIRHIVRNATLKNAIEAEQKFQVEHHGEPRALQVMTQIARGMGIQGDFKHSVEATMAIYKNAYLNLGNLFPGAGAINRVIGLTADGISKLGAELLSSDDFAEPEKISDLFEQVALQVARVGDQMDRQAETMSPQTAKIFLGGFEGFFDNLEDYLIDREEELVKAASTDPDSVNMEDVSEEVLIGVTEAEIGREFLDIGANFGFDIPDEALRREDMQQLVMTETFLANYSAGNPSQLANALAHFMKVKAVMKV